MSVSPKSPPSRLTTAALQMWCKPPRWDPADLWMPDDILILGCRFSCSVNLKLGRVDLPHSTEHFSMYLQTRKTLFSIWTQGYPSYTLEKLHKKSLYKEAYMQFSLCSFLILSILSHSQVKTCRVILSPLKRVYSGLCGAQLHAVSLHRWNWVYLLPWAAQVWSTMATD